MSDPNHQQVGTHLTNSQIQQRLEALIHTCEMLNVRMEEFEQVLLNLEGRLQSLPPRAYPLPLAIPRKRKAPGMPKTSARDPIQLQPKPSGPSPSPGRCPRWGGRWRWPWRLQRQRLLLLGLLLLLPTLGVVWQGYQPTPTTSALAPELPASQPAMPERESTLEIQARGPTWLEVKSNSGKTLYFGMMKPGRLSFPVQSGLLIRAGRPHLVVVSFRNRTQPLGKAKDLGWKQFRPS